jgi:hypothetical protein
MQRECDMRRTLASLVVASATMATAAVALPAAAADSADVVHGGCFFQTQQQSGSTTNTGVIGDRSVTTTGSPVPAPIGATVTCWIRVNGVAAPGTTHSYGDLAGVPGVQAGADPLTFTGTDADTIDECQTVAFADGTSTTGCVGATYNPTPCGQTTEDCLVPIEDTLFYGYIDPLVCPVLVAHAGRYPGGVTIAPDGDVYVPDPLGLFDSGPVYDCPPYNNYPPFG